MEGKKMVSKSTLKRQERGRDNHNKVRNYLVGSPDHELMVQFIEAAENLTGQQDDKNPDLWHLRYGPVDGNAPSDIRNKLQKAHITITLDVVDDGKPAWGCVDPCPNYKHALGEPLIPVPPPWSPSDLPQSPAPKVSVDHSVVNVDVLSEDAKWAIRKPSADLRNHPPLDKLPCYHCSGPPEELEHHIARARLTKALERLRWQPENLTSVCWPCNHEKSSMAAWEWEESRLERGLQWPPPAGHKPWSDEIRPQWLAQI
jgi:hypothetical protein